MPGTAPKTSLETREFVGSKLLNDCLSSKVAMLPVVTYFFYWPLCGVKLNLSHRVRLKIESILKLAPRASLKLKTFATLLLKYRLNLPPLLA